MMSNSLNVFKYNYDHRKFTHFFSNVVQFFRNIKYAWQRATCGYCDPDTWGLYDYYSELIPNTLKYLADNTHSYPQEFESPDKWNEMLYKIADKIKYSDPDQFETPFEDELFNKVYFTGEKDDNGCTHIVLKPTEGNTQEDVDKARELQQIEYQAIRRDALRNLKEGLRLLEKYWYDLWD